MKIEKRELSDEEQGLAKLDQIRQEREAFITVALEGRSQSEVWEERLLAIEARLDKVEKIGRKI